MFWVKLPAMKNVRLLIADLFLPEDFGVSAGMQLPALEKILARGEVQTLQAVSLEDALCALFAMPPGLAAISAEFDGLARGCWLRADPVHVRLQREQVVLLPNVNVSQEESAQFISSLNDHFNGQGMAFFAPHPERWYVRLDALPDIVTVPLSQAAGCNIRGNLPVGADARRWQQLFNEIQMLLFNHPLNEAREARGEAPVNSVWFWGERCSPDRKKNAAFNRVSSDDVRVEMLASHTGVSFKPWQSVWDDSFFPVISLDREKGAEQLLVFTGLRSALQRGDLAAWRDALQAFESGYAQPLWQALRAGKINRLELDVLGGDGIRKSVLSRGNAWSFWKRSRRLSDYAVADVK